jgi:hypothetical protein
MADFRGAATRWGALLSTWLACTIGGCGGEDGELPAGSSEDTGSSTDESSESGDACVADCQPGGTVLWETHVGGPGEDSAVAVAVGADGRIAFVGVANISNDGVMDTWSGLVGLFEADGTLVFQDMPGSHTSGVGFASDGTIVVAGETPLPSLILRGYDDVGTVLWESADATTRPAGSGVLAILPNDEIVVGGGTETAGMLARYDRNGAELMYTELPVNIFVTALLGLEGNIWATGADFASMFWVGRTDLQGAVEWQATGPQNQRSALALADDGNVIVAANTPTGGGWIFIYDAAGTSVASAPLPRQDVIAIDLAVLPDGDLLLAGASAQPLRCWYARMDSMTTFAWQSDFAGEPEDSECRTIDIAPDGTVIVSGKHLGPSGTKDAWIRRVAP